MCQLTRFRGRSVRGFLSVGDPFPSLSNAKGGLHLEMYMVSPFRGVPPERHKTGPQGHDGYSCKRGGGWYS